MWETLGRLLPLSTAMAISSVPIMATILILLSPNRVRSALPFLMGWVAGLAAVLTGCIALAQILPVREVMHPQTTVGLILIAVGIALVVLAVISARRPRTDGAGMPRWLTAVGSIGPVRAVGLAVALNLRPKALLLAIAAALNVRAATLTAGETATLVVVYTAISASTVVGPIVFSIASPERAGSWLLASRSWIEQNTRTVTVLILLVIGVVIVGDGLTRL